MDHLNNIQKCCLKRDDLDPMRCGISGGPKEFDLESLYGVWFVRGQLLLDFTALDTMFARSCTASDRVGTGIPCMGIGSRCAIEMGVGRLQ